MLSNARRQHQCKGMFNTSTTASNGNMSSTTIEEGSVRRFVWPSILADSLRNLEDLRIVSARLLYPKTGNTVVELAGTYSSAFAVF
jgi:hypothetical protein